jgi:Arc/MetJ family transcription regulator
MRTNIDIDDELMRLAMQSGNFKSKKETVEAGLRLLARKSVYQELRKLRGKLHWEGDLRAERNDIRDQDLIDPPETPDADGR